MDPLQREDGVSTSAWAPACALDRLEGDEELLKELCQIFLQESPKLLQKLKEGLDSRNCDAVQRAAHSIKGEVSYLAAAAATEAARRLEVMGHGGDLAGAIEVFAELQREMSLLRDTIERVFGVQP